jgi:DNA uptake protein ComE-like DNA-binding protein
LLQVLVALGLVLALLAAVFVFLHDIVDARDRARVRSLRQETAAAFFERVEADLAMAIAGSPGAGAGVIGGPQSLSVLTRGTQPDPLRAREGMLDLRRHTYRHDPAAQTLIGSRALADGGDEERVDFEGRVAHLRMRFHDGERWRSTFDSLDAGGLPAAVEVALWFALPAELLEELASGAQNPDGGEESVSSGADGLTERAGRSAQGDAATTLREIESPALPPPDRLRVLAIPDGGRPTLPAAAAEAPAPADSAPADAEPAEDQGDESGARRRTPGARLRLRVVRAPQRRAAASRGHSSECPPERPTRARPCPKSLLASSGCGCGWLRRRLLGVALRLRSRRGSLPPAASLALGPTARFRTGPRSRSARSSRARRAFLLISVLIALAMALAVVAGMLMLARADAAAVATHQRVAQSRALAWSGVQVIGAELQAQRERLLQGDAPSLPQQFVIFETSDALGVVRLLPLGENGRGQPSLLRAEGGLLDLNRADAARLAATGMVDSAQGEAIVARRSAAGGRFLSESELLSVSELPPERLFGSLERLLWASDAGRPIGTSLRERTGDGARQGGGSLDGHIDRLSVGEVQASARGLLEAVTAFAVEPQVRRDGQPRLCLADGGSEEMAERWMKELSAPLGASSDEVAELLAAAVESWARSGPPESDAALVKLLPPSVSLDAMAGLLDSVTVHPGSWRGGRIDINTAPYEAILSLPGLSEQQAAEIIREREGLSDDERWTPTWLIAKGIVDREQFAELIELVTTRCLLWRARVVAGEVSPEAPEGAIAHAVAWEVVIDLSPPRWRVAYLRDATLLPLAATMFAVGVQAEERGAPRFSAPIDGTKAAESGPDGSGATSGESEADAIPEPQRPEMTQPTRRWSAGADRRGTSKPEEEVGASGGRSAPARQARSPAGPPPVGRWRAE